MPTDAYGLSPNKDEEPTEHDPATTDRIKDGISMKFRSFANHASEALWRMLSPKHRSAVPAKNASNVSVHSISAAVSDILISKHNL
jgi:hypothetical protein